MIAPAPFAPKTSSVQGVPARLSPEREVAFAKMGVGAALLCAALLWPCLFFPIGKDASVFLLGGRVLTSGGVLYRDVWDIKPPLIYMLACLPAHLPLGYQVVGFQALAVLAAMMCAFFGALLVAPVAGRSVALSAAPILAALLLFPATTSLGQCESWANAFGLAALWLWHTRSAKRSRAMLAAISAGALIGSIPLLKATSLLPLLPFLFLARRGKRDFAFAALGFALPILLALAWLRATGAQGFYHDIVDGFLSFYVRGGGANFASRASWFGVMTLYRAFQTGPFAVLCCVGLFDRTTWPAPWKRALMASLGLGLLAMWVQNRNVIYQWTVMLPAFCFLSASGALALARTLRLPRAERVVPALLVAWCLFATRDEWSAFVLGRSETARNAVLAARNEVAEKPRDVAKVAHWLSDLARPNDRMFVWGFEPALYVYGPRPANRFVYVAPLCATFAPAKWRDEAWRSLQNQPPRFVVVQSHFRLDDLGAAPRDMAQLWRETPVYPWFVQHYAKRTQSGNYAVYERASSPVAR